MGIYERMRGEEDPGFSGQQIIAVVQEFSLGNMTAAQVRAALQFTAGSVHETELTNLRQLILNQTNANGNTQLFLRRSKTDEVAKVFDCFESGYPPYDGDIASAVAALKTRLGPPVSS